MKKIFITGISGFIGSHLAIDLFEKGYHIIGGDITHTPCKTLLEYKDSYHDQEDLKNRFKLYKIDFSDSRLYNNLEFFKDIDLIYHLASPIGVRNVIENSGTILRQSTKINSFIDTVCEKYNIPIVYSSSSEVHGSGVINSESNYNIKKFNESPRWSYAAAKTHGEFLYLSSVYPSIIIRFFNVVGKGQVTKGMVIPTFVNAAKNNEDLIILENGTRSYCDVREALEYIVPIGIDLMDNKLQSKYSNENFNIGNTENNISADTLAKKIIDIFDSKSKITYDSNYMDYEELPLRQLEQDNELMLDIEVTNIKLEDILLNIKDDKEVNNDNEV